MDLFMDEKAMKKGKKISIIRQKSFWWRGEVVTGKGHAMFFCYNILFWVHVSLRVHFTVTLYAVHLRFIQFKIFSESLLYYTIKTEKREIDHISNTLLTQFLIPIKCKKGAASTLSPQPRDQSLAENKAENKHSVFFN